MNLKYYFKIYYINFYLNKKNFYWYIDKYINTIKKNFGEIIYVIIAFPIAISMVFCIPCFVISASRGISFKEEFFYCWKLLLTYSFICINVCFLYVFGKHVINYFKNIKNDILRELGL
jgi:hypothetical protein